jgi:hypothetical protein
MWLDLCSQVKRPASQCFLYLSIFSSSGGTYFGEKNGTGLLGANYTISNMGGVVGRVLLIQLNSTVLYLSVA